MVLILHIVFALSSIALTTLAFFLPSSLKIKVSSYLVGLTLASGTYIVIAGHLSIKSVCLSGLLYVGFTISGLVLASRRLAHQNHKSD
jgi:hypothetical protein